MKDKIDKILLILLSILITILGIYFAVNQYNKTTVTLEQATTVEDNFVKIQRAKYGNTFVCQNNTYDIAYIDNETTDRLVENDDLILFLYKDKYIIQISKNGEIVYPYETYILKARKAIELL